MTRNPRLCGARNRQGGRCGKRPVPTKRRCHLHGGRLTGGYRGGSTKPANAAYRVKLELFRALGLKWYGGRPRKPKMVLSMAEEADRKLGTDIAVLQEALPALQPGSLGAVLGEVSLEGLHRMREIVRMPLDEGDPKQMRLIGDMAVAANKLFMRLAENAYRAQKDDVLAQLLERLRQQQEQAVSKK